MKLLCLIEATTVIGPAKNLLNFCRLMRAPEFCANGNPRIEVSIVSFDRSPSGDPGNSFVRTAREMGVEVDVINERFRFDPQVIEQLKTIVERRQPDIIQTHMIKSHFLVKLSGLRKQYPWIAYHHGYTATDVKMRFYNQLNRWSLPSASRVITVCDAFAKQLSETGVRSDRIAVRHNAVVAPRQLTQDARQALRNELGIARDDSVMLAVGRLSREKGHDDLIQAVATLRDSDSALKFKLVIVGDGPERASLQQTVSRHGLDEQVIFIGHVNDVAPYYAIADVLALPSHSEGSPNVLLEAMAAGIPAVATAVGGVPEIATTEESALLVASRDSQAFASAMRRVVSDEAFAMTLAANAKARVAKDFSPESHARSLIKIYEEVTEPRANQGPHAGSPRETPVSSETCLNHPVAIPSHPESDTVSI